MAKNPPKEKNPEKNKKLKEEKTEFSDLDKGGEKKPKFQDLLPPEEEDAASEKSSRESSLPGSDDEIPLDDNIVEICADVIAIPFEIWNKLNPKIHPLTESEKRHISKPLAKVVAKYHVDKFMKDEFVLLFYLGSAVYGRVKIKKDDVNHSREKEKGKNYSSEKSHS